MSSPAAGVHAIRAEVAELLGVDVAAIDPLSDLVSQGLDSIRMMALAGRWRRSGHAVDFAALAAAPTVTAWSALLSTAAQAEPDTPAAAEPDATGEPFPLAPMQHAMWVGRQDNQPLGGVAGHLYVEFDGDHIDPDRLRAAAADLALRHPMLRVRFLPDGTQRVDPRRADFPVTVHDLRDLAADAVEQRLAELRTAKSYQQLDGQVLELTLTLLPGLRSRLHVDLDMQAADAMSYRTLMADLAALYQRRELPELKYTYREYRQEMLRREAVPDPKHDADRDWWARRLPELPDPPRLPYRTGGDRISRTSSRRWHWLDPQTRDALFANARAHSVTPAMAFASVFAHTLAYWSKSPRFLLNVPLFARESLHPDVDHLVGDFTSSLLLDLDLTCTATAAARAHVVQDEMRTAAAHSGYPGLSVLRDLSRHRGTQVLAPVVFTSALGLGELFSAEVTEQFGTPDWIISQGPQVALDAQVTEFDGGVLVNWDVRDDVFETGVIDAMFAHHIDELRRLAEDPGAWDTASSAALPPSQQAVRAAVNTNTVAPSGEALHDGFFRNAEAQPDAPAIYASSGALSYAELRRQVLAVAAALRDIGIHLGDAVAVMGPKNAEQVPALLGILAAGGVYLPIGVDQPTERAARILSTAGVGAVLVCGSHPVQAPVPVLTIAEALQKYRADSLENICAATDPGDVAYVLFTSGSTGEPKGVEVTHDAAMNTVEFITRHFEIGPDDRCLALSTLECDMSVLDIFATLRAGGAIVVVDEEQRRDPDAWARLIDTHQVTVLNFLPGWLEMLVEVGAGRLSSVRVVPSGGDWVRPQLARRLRAESPTMRFAGLGGATETAVHATIFEVDQIGELPEQWTAVPYGKPLPNIACRVVNEMGGDCPDWVVGELWVSGRGIARGYRGRPDLTGQRFVAHDGRTWYRTGDLARYWPDGTLEFVGRADHRVKISGYRVELGEVEAVLRRIAGVTAAVAGMVPTSGGAEVLAAVVCVDDPALSCERVREAMSELAPAHMVPRHVSLVERIPFTVGGKIDRRAVADQLSADVAGAGKPGHRPASTPVQAALVTIIGDVLGVDAVGVDDDFFALGGDSVLATQAVAAIRVWLDTPDVMVADMFAARTVSALADLLERRDPDRGRLQQVAELYLDVAGMAPEKVLAETTAPVRTQ
ncbi:non-ribosomal peptide synthetase [Mycobacterium shimoidei]|uniref:non-ribosomal peptide synthetase n=1 Tax=Mycobacterium shimoidei TaxID=29313 RepID=UPI0008491E54|nr:non-ribosomal peptide synthetase [Mycobacterium shimoidei]MCV7258321.1 non-ribosomal peptide synthetase [Mycobacterium shimoidei]ODR12358.1 non-ribosomal peptide synthetase [Mycobacterium shimoidei]ORW82823.1 non-ribosomal peptide synthetase [Mycobacterium shimoidei]